MGVTYNPKRNEWCSSFYRAGRMEKKHCKWFKTREQAEKDFNHVKRIYSVRRSNVHDYTGFENKFIKIICLTNSATSNGGRVYLAQNKTDWRFRTINARWLSKKPDLAGAPMPYRHKYNGYSKINKRGEIKYQAALRVNGKNNILGVFDSAKKAHEAYIAGRDSYYFAPPENVEAYRQHLIKTWGDNSKVRRSKARHNLKRNRKLPYQHIFPAPGGYVCSIRVNGKLHRKYSVNLSTVIEDRNKFIKEHNLPIPDDRKD